MGPSGEEERRQEVGRTPSPLVRIGQGEGVPPLSFLSPSSFPLLLFQLGKKGVLLPVGVGLPLARPS